MIKSSRFVIVYILLAVTALYINLHADAAVLMNKPFSAFPVQVQGWHLLSEAQFSQSILDVLRPTDYLSRIYGVGDGKGAQLYIGYHSGAKGEGGIHSPKNCLPGSGWYEASSKRSSLDVGGKKVHLVQAVYQKGESKELFIYWFQVQGKTLSDEYSLKLAEITNSMLHRRKDAAFVRVSVPFEGDEEAALATGTKFVRDFYPLIQDFLPS
jgi:EpsI family protein